MVVCCSLVMQMVPCKPLTSGTSRSIPAFDVMSFEAMQQMIIWRGSSAAYMQYHMAECSLASACEVMSSCSFDDAAMCSL